MNHIYNNFYIKNNYTNFINLLDISGYFKNVNNLNKVIKYIDDKNNKVFIYDINTNLENIETKFSDKKLIIDWLIISSQITFFARERNQERWENNIPWINKDNIDIIYNNLKYLAFTEEKGFSHEKYKDVVILGATYAVMEKRLLYLVSKIDRLKTDRITFLTANDRVIKFDEKLYNCMNKHCLKMLFSKIDNTSEQKIFYEYFNKTGRIRYIFRFTKKFKEAINNNITEKTMAEILLYNYKIKINKIDSRILGSYAEKESGRIRANTGDTIKTLLQEDNIKNINDLKRYVFVSGQPYIERQKISTLIASLEYFNISEIPDNFSIEFVGYGNELQKTKSSIKLHIQTFASTLFMRYILFLSKYTKDLNKSKDYVIKNLSYESTKDLITIK